MNERVFAVGPMKRLAGSGKTRFVIECALELTSRGIQVMTLRPSRTPGPRCL
jgi:hypothetical protein